jgi:hypothetical protein
MRIKLPVLLSSSLLISALSIYHTPLTYGEAETLSFHLVTPHQTEFSTITSENTNRQQPEEDEHLSPERRFEHAEWDLAEFLKPPDSVPLFSIGYTEPFPQQRRSVPEPSNHRKTENRANLESSTFVPSGPLYTGPLGLLELLKPDGFRPEVKGPILEEAPRPGIPLVDNKQVRSFIKLFTKTKKKSFQAGINRSGRYLPMIRELLREEGPGPRECGNS